MILKKSTYIILFYNTDMLLQYHRNVLVLRRFAGQWGMRSHTGFKFSIWSNKFVSKSQHVDGKLYRQFSLAHFKRNSSSSLATTLTYNFSDSNVSLIHSLEQYKKGSQMLRIGQYPLAIRQFQMAFKFLPKQLTSGEQNGNYKEQYQDLLKMLLESHIMMNKPLLNFRRLYQPYIDSSTRFGQFLNIIQHLQNTNYKYLQEMSTDDKLWKQLIRAFAFKSSSQCFGKQINIQKVNQTKDLTLKYIGLYLYEKIKARKNKEREDVYLNTCRQLLKQVEQFQPEQLVKPISLMACNLLAGEQYLQAQGLLNHCLSTLQTFYHHTPIFLKTDQQYIMCKLLMARVFEGVNRNRQAKEIREEYEKLFDEKRLLIQELTHVGFRVL